MQTRLLLDCYLALDMSIDRYWTFGWLDREEQDDYLVKVVATDGAWRTETNVGITVQASTISM